MRNEINHSTSRIVFSRWSRKTYAVFASLGKEVTIGQIDVEIANCAYAKSCFEAMVWRRFLVDGSSNEVHTGSFSLFSELEILFSNMMETLVSAVAAFAFYVDENHILVVNDISTGKKGRIPMQ